jgi:acetyl esterase/lipase
MDNEGHDVARYLADRGVAAHVLKYRVVPTPAADAEFQTALMEAFTAGMEDAVADTLPLAIADAARAVELVRRDGAGHVTLLGLSAGARLVADLAMTGEPDHRPDAGAAIYVPPVRDLPAPHDAPPLFIAAAADDAIVGIDPSLQLHAAWRDVGRPVELHLFERGGHGFGMQRQQLPSDRWADLFLAWLDTHVA